jgi:hypothetical protein
MASYGRMRIKLVKIFSNRMKTYNHPVKTYTKKKALHSENELKRCVHSLN